VPGLQRIEVEPSILVVDNSEAGSAAGDPVYNEANIACLRKALLQSEGAALLCSPRNQADVAAYRHLYRRLKHCTSLKAWVLAASTPPDLRSSFEAVMREANPAIPVLTDT
jgi:hypothetical protein